MICPIWAGVSVPVGSYTNTAYENGGMPIPLITWKYHSGFSRTDALIETGGSKFAAKPISAAALGAAVHEPLAAISSACRGPYAGSSSSFSPTCVCEPGPGLSIEDQPVTGVEISVSVPSVTAGVCPMTCDWNSATQFVPNVTTPPET